MKKSMQTIYFWKEKKKAQVNLKENGFHGRIGGWAEGVGGL